MRILLQGLETTERIEKVLAATRIRSERKIKALHDHFVKGTYLAGAAWLNDLDPDKLGELVKKFHKVAYELSEKGEL